VLPAGPGRQGLRGLFARETGHRRQAEFIPEGKNLFLGLPEKTAASPQARAVRYWKPSSFAPQPVLGKCMNRQ